MTYVKQTWNNGIAGGTAISAARLAYMETGIEQAVSIPAATDAVIYVSGGVLGNDANSGLTEDKPKLTIAGGVAAIVALTGFGPGSGGTLKIAFGDYILPSTVSYPGDRLVIQGAKYGLTRIIAPNNALALDIGQAGVIGREFRMEGVTLYRATPGGAGLIRVRKMDQSRISDCGFAGGTINIEMTNCIASIVERCGINSYTVDGLAIDNSDQCAITCNTFETNFGGQNHIKVNSGNKALSINANIFSTAVRAVYVDGGPSDDCSLTANVVENCNNGFVIGGATNPSSSRWVIVGNNLRGVNAASSVGIRVYGSHHIISGNNVSQYTASIDESGAASSNHRIGVNQTDVPINITSTGSSAGSITFSASDILASMGAVYLGTSLNPVAGAVRIFPLSSPSRSIIQVGNGSAWETVIEFLDTKRMAFFGAPAVSQPLANPDTSGATLGDLETEVNQIKAALRSLGLIAT